LLKQLVVRDFKTKYKRSVLGILWSFLNPLLTMLVLYIVFSTLFKSSIANFPVYLLSGIVVWSFFNEATGMCLSSITGNAGLITKVNVPKYIYPFSRTLSSLVNFMFSLLPLLIVMLITRTSFHLPILLLPFPIFCLFIFALGIGLMLATSMVFFRDTQFLWGVVSTLWMYLTPIFCDVGIIPARFLLLYKMNPLYHLVRTFRIILIQGVSPEPKAYLLCLVASLVPFVLGVIVFKKNENRFVFYL
jgi:ABC-2 type transport system permease protein